MTMNKRKPLKTILLKLGVDKLFNVLYWSVVDNYSRTISFILLQYVEYLNIYFINCNKITRIMKKWMF